MSCGRRRARRMPGGVAHAVLLALDPVSRCGTGHTGGQGRQSLSRPTAHAAIRLLDRSSGVRPALKRKLPAAAASRAPFGLPTPSQLTPMFREMHVLGIGWECTSGRPRRWPGRRVPDAGRAREFARARERPVSCLVLQAPTVALDLPGAGADGWLALVPGHARCLRWVGGAPRLPVRGQHLSPARPPAPCPLVFKTLSPLDVARALTLPLRSTHPQQNSRRRCRAGQDHHQERLRPGGVLRGALGGWVGGGVRARARELRARASFRGARTVAPAPPRLLPHSHSKHSHTNQNHTNSRGAATARTWSRSTRRPPPPWRAPGRPSSL